ncbi:MAG: DegT/DnrJ/EryC1/StrS family aminotransferase [Planctomycetota bacterium]|jgi:dTDP-4-amino-4,6-dideoxygalactose transaminase
MVDIPLVDLKAQYRPLKEDILGRIATILDSMRLFLGPNVQALEQEFSAFDEVEHAIGVSEGTTALQLALMACDIGAGDEVITVSHTFIATAESISLTGAKPIFVDIDPRTYTMDVEQIEAKISGKTRAIVPVHLYGQPADMDSIVAIAERHNLWVIEDACQSHGARYKGRRTGGLGHMAAYSFYFSKNLGAYGEAGMVTTTDGKLAEKVRMLRDHGSSQRYHHELVGMNGRLDEIQAAILRAKLPYLESWNGQRREHAAHYAVLLSGIETVIVPETADYAEHVFHLYVVRVPRRDELREYLYGRGVGTGIHYPIPCHLQPAFRSLGYQRGDLPVTEQVAGEILSLPMYAELTAEQRVYIASTVREFYATSRPAPE